MCRFIDGKPISLLGAVCFRISTAIILDGEYRSYNDSPIRVYYEFTRIRNDILSIAVMTL